MIPAYLVVLAVVPRDGRYLVVEELDGTFYLPAGKVEPGEDLISAVVRETAEEAGVPIAPRGLLGLDHQCSPRRIRLRFAFVGAPTRDVAPKSRADEHTRGAAWVRRAELAAMPLRHPEVLGWIDRYERATALLPCAAYEPYLAAAHGR